jgi:uncharacterized protein (TIGR02246 family)
MSSDEQAIRQLIADWHRYTRSGDISRVLALMTEDVVFTVVGRPPFGKAEFEQGSRQLQNVKIEGQADVLEVSVRGDTAWARVKLSVAMTSPDGKRTERSGHAMSIYLKQPDGRWLLARDANLLGPPQQ